MPKPPLRSPALPLPPSLATQLWQLPARSLVRFWQTLLQWQDRASGRHRLSLMGERELMDFGVTRSDAEGEINKPFWRK